METKIQKWGNSLGVRLPKEIAARQKLSAGSRVKITEKDDQVVLSVVDEPTETLEELVAQITPDNRHPEVDWGKPVGKEIW